MARLTLFDGRNFQDRRLQIRRRGLAIRNMSAIRFDNDLSSFRLRRNNSANVTLVLFSQANYQGAFRVFRGNAAIANLSNFNFNNRTSSLIFILRNLTDAQIRNIQSNARAPRGIAEIRR